MWSITVQYNRMEWSIKLLSEQRGPERRVLTKEDLYWSGVAGQVLTLFSTGVGGGGGRTFCIELKITLLSQRQISGKFY